MSILDRVSQYDPDGLTRTEFVRARASAPPLVAPIPRAALLAIPGELPWRGRPSEEDGRRETRREWDARGRGEPPRHGTTYAYQTYRCRCPECRYAKTVKQRERRARRKFPDKSQRSVIPRRDN